MSYKHCNNVIVNTIMAERRHVRKSHSVTDDDDDFANESVPLLQTSTDDTAQGPTDNSSDGVRYVL